jgi:hypothetical protein
MPPTDLQAIAQTVCRRAQRQGFILPREIRDELVNAGLAEALWKDVLARARPPLHYRHGRYYFGPVVSARAREEQTHQRAIHATVRQIIRQYRQSAAQLDRRRQGRVDFVQPVKTLSEDGRERTLLSRDLSLSGIRLVGTRSLLGQKLRVLVPRADGAEPCCFVVRILWTCAVGDDLFENGGTFVEVLSGAG